ncbi:hypothetical protein N7536_003472 [Penicillium majusculum]|uniref:Uncharacterized protein n=1 Tax=Penicillium solitum TaxID=60172 RepID=A0A1V6RK65_9EURO|nr:uncharacterized protein PENSOL_c003G11765 [Penicillium solitum]KAJ5700459.1 hypothetical protein N7536_003472 [Penicillium majusculum]OQE01918.1 hypothetical protein PENSOL_c003G11765 [Penicillium solitum]
MTDANNKKPSSTTPMAGSASVSASDMDRNAEEIMRLAIARFRSRMAAANKKFFQDRLKEIEEKGLATEEDKREQLRHGSIIRIPPQTPVKDLDIPAILNALPSYAPVDGVQSPLLRSDQWRQMYLDTVQRVCQQQVDEIVAEDDEDRDVACTWHKDRPMTIPPCDELALFLKYAQGVADVDFRLSGIAPFTPAWSVGVRDEELEGLDERQRRDKSADPELLKREQEQLQRLLEYELEDKTLRAFIDDDLDIRAGFIADIRFHKRHACPAWYCAYVYCQLMMDDDEDENKHKDEDIQDAANIKEWWWRVVFFKAEADNPTPLYGRKARFDSIPEFLDWYASWLDHLDARALLSLRRHAVACETDCESDCEDH